MITKLTPQQEESIVSYQQKWKAIYLSTERIDRSRVLDVLKVVFRAYPESFTMPEVIFFESPYAAFSAELKVATANFNGLSDDEVVNEVFNLQTLRGDGQHKRRFMVRFRHGSISVGDDSNNEFRDLGSFKGKSYR